MAIHQLKSDEEVESVNLTVLWKKPRHEIGLIDGLESFHGEF